MSPSKRLRPVQRVARSREQQAARSLGESKQSLQAEQAKLLQLMQYHEEYVSRFEVAARNGLSSPQLQEYRAFLDKLDAAVRQQEGIVAACEVEHSSKQDDWRQRHTRSQALNNVVHRYQQQERANAERQEQKENDERNQRSSKDT